MIALAERWETDPDALADAALEAPRCQCGDRAILDGDECAYCGKEIREPGTLGREFRRAAYDRRLRWARGAGLDPRHGFRGLRVEVGLNPPLPALDAALSPRVEELLPVEGDPFAQDPEPSRQGPVCRWARRAAT